MSRLSQSVDVVRHWRWQLCKGPRLLRQLTAVRVRSIQLGLASRKLAFGARQQGIFNSMLIFIKRNWPLLLHEVQRKRSYMSKGKKVDVEQTVMEVNVDEIRDLYVSMFGKNLAAEKAKRTATAKKRKAPDVNVNEKEKDTTVSVEEVVANTASPESAGPSRERATTRQSASEARMNEAADFIAQFNADPTQYGQCSVCIDMEDCIFDSGDATPGTLHVDEDMVVGVDKCFLSTPNAAPHVDPLIQLMESHPDEHFNDDGTLTAAAHNLLAGFSDCDVAMSMEPIDDVSSSDDEQ